MVLFVSVCVSVVPTTTPAGAVLLEKDARLALYACTSVPISSPKFVLAFAAVVAFVPPFATGSAELNALVMSEKPSVTAPVRVLNEVTVPATLKAAACQADPDQTNNWFSEVFQ